MKSVSLLCSLLLLAPAPAQTPVAAPSPAAPQSPVIRVTTRMVQVNVVVHGKKGEPMAGLTKDDFEITDDGKPQTVASVTVEGAVSTDNASVAAKIAKLPPNLFGNLPAFRDNSPKAVTIVLMDGLNTAFADQAYARQQLIKFLGTLTPNDRVALYTLGRDVRILHDFTDDPAVLLKALDRHRAHIGSELADSNPEESNTGNDDLDAFLDQANQQIADYQTIGRVRTTLNAIQAIAQHVAALPGRKNLVWISGGFPFSIGMEEMNIDSTAERRTFSDELEHAARAVNDASLAIYPIDARGLVAMPDFSASKGPSKNATRPPSGPSKAMQALMKDHDTMNMLAQRTGGKAFYNANDIRGAIRSAIDDSKLTYVLGYYPTHSTWDGKFHQLKVHVKRPGVNVRHRAGYFAFPDQVQTEQMRKSALAEAAWSPLDASRVAITLRLAPDVPQKGVLRMVMAVEPRHITLEQKDDRWVGTVDVLFVLQPAPDKPAVTIPQTLNMNLTKATYLGILKTGMVMAKDFNYADAAYRFKVVVRDVPSGRIGSVNVRSDRLKPVTAATAPAKAAEPAK